MNQTLIKRWETLVTSANPTLFESLAKFFLHLISTAYGGVIHLRNWGYQEKIFSIRTAETPVISIGNISLGGTGKTQIVIWCAEEIKAAGKKPMIISRGYGRIKKDEEISIVSDGNEILTSEEDSGDEPLLMARKLKGIPILVGADRAHAAQWGKDRFSPDLIILDDGFQHRGLERNLDVVCIDEKMLEAPRTFPAGFLRESAQSISRAQFLLMKTNNEGLYRAQFNKIFGFFPQIPSAAFTYRADLVVDHTTGNTVSTSALSKRPIYAFSGISNPKDFERILKDSGSELVAFETFPDHHRFSEKELEVMVDEAKQKNALLLTTEKDRMRIPAGVPVWSLRVSVRWHQSEDEKAFLNKILN